MAPAPSPPSSRQPECQALGKNAGPGREEPPQKQIRAWNAGAEGLIGPGVLSVGFFSFEKGNHFEKKKRELESIS